MSTITTIAAKNKTSYNKLATTNNQVWSKRVPTTVVYSSPLFANSTPQKNKELDQLLNSINLINKFNLKNGIYKIKVETGGISHDEATHSQTLCISDAVNFGDQIIASRLYSPSGEVKNNTKLTQKELDQIEESQSGEFFFEVTL